MFQHGHLVHVVPAAHEPGGLALDALLAEPEAAVQAAGAGVPAEAGDLDAVQAREVEGPVERPRDRLPAVALAPVRGRDREAQRRAAVLRPALVGPAQRDEADGLRGPVRQTHVHGQQLAGCDLLDCRVHLHHREADGERGVGVYDPAELPRVRWRVVIACHYGDRIEEGGEEGV